MVSIIGTSPSFPHVRSGFWRAIKYSLRITWFFFARVSAAFALHGDVPKNVRHLLVAAGAPFGGIAPDAEPWPIG